MWNNSFPDWTRNSLWNACNEYVNDYSRTISNSGNHSDGDRSICHVQRAQEMEGSS